MLNSYLFSLDLKSNKNFKIVGTTADVGIVAYGGSLQKLFAHAAEGLTYILTDTDRIEKTVTQEIELHGTDLENLLVKWLNEILYLFEVKEFLGKKFKISTLSKNYLQSEIEGEYYKREKHIFKTEIKAVTYHQLYLKQEKGKWVTNIIFDL